MDDQPEREPEVNKVFRMARKHGARSFYLEAGSPPLMLLRGVGRKVDMQPLSRQNIEDLLTPLLTPGQRERFDAGGEVAFLYSCEEGNVYRVRVFTRDGQPRLAAHQVTFNASDDETS